MAHGLITHGHRSRGVERSTTYESWVGMRQRCTNPRNKRYVDYGGRGITICERWDSFENFLADMGERPRGTSIERIDNNGHYELSNCEWATDTEQGRNTRRLVLTMEIVRMMRDMHAHGVLQTDIAVLLGIASNHVCMVVNNYIWKEDI